jgi:transcriptional regulator with PAS, ATPase and Fis domain
MDSLRYHISPYVIIPIVFAGFATIATLVSFRITEYCLVHGIGPFWPISGWAVLISTISFACSLLILRLILRPVEKFIQKAEKLPIISSTSQSSTMAGDDLHRFSKVFSQVANALDKVEARQFFPEIIGESRTMRTVFSQILKVAPTDAAVLIYGESGTGKDLVAKSIHNHSARKQEAFTRINCVAIPEKPLEKELFGYESGGSLGPATVKKGKLEMTEGGTLFLDEIGEMPTHTQARILRFLQENEFEREGGSSPIGCDVRIIASSSKNLEKLVQKGKFREELYVRLNAFSIILPSLRERKEDIPLLVDHLLLKHGEKQEGMESEEEEYISSAALQVLMAYSWSGNVGELENIIERAALMSDGKSIDVMHLPVNIKNNTVAAPHGIEPGSLDDQLQEIEKGLIIEALMKTGGTQVKSAELLGINQRSLWHRIKKYEIDVQALKNYKK